MMVPTRLVGALIVFSLATGAPSQAGRLASHRHAHEAEYLVAPSATFDAVIDMSSGSYANAGTLTTGNAQAWYNSAAISRLFGGTPTLAQQAAFESSVLQDVQQTFRLSGVSVALTDNPSAQANHTLSLVSNTSSLPFPGAIGTTYIGGNGFSFIDPEANAAQNLNQLTWIVAHNISHELMLAFGVGENYDQSGNDIDSRNASWAMMVNPNSTFSPGAAGALNQAHLSQTSGGSVSPSKAQMIEAVPIPEPATMLIWGAGLLGLSLIRWSRSRE